jgi:hypothetical protein
MISSRKSNAEGMDAMESELTPLEDVGDDIADTARKANQMTPSSGESEASGKAQAFWLLVWMAK